MPDLLLRPNLIPLHAWLIEAGTSDVAAETLFDGFCGRLAGAGVPIARGFLSIAGLHPLRRAYLLTGDDGRIAGVTDFWHAALATAGWAKRALPPHFFNQKRRVCPPRGG